MKIRSITCFIDPRHDPQGVLLERMAEFCSDAREKLAGLSIEVQSTRLSSPPFPEISDCCDGTAVTDAVLAFQAAGVSHGFAYTSCGPSLPQQPLSDSLVPGLLVTAKDTFISTIIADDRFIYPRAIRSAAHTIKTVSTNTADGFTNLRFATLANTRPYGPFFPGSYAVSNEKPAFSLAIECADAVLAAFQSKNSLALQREHLTNTLNNFAQTLTDALSPLADEYEVNFKGFDFSPAPFPEPGCSLGGAVEALGVELGKSGALAATAVVADTLNAGNWKHAGYNGLMLPVLEDSLLAERAASGQLTIQDLLLFSTVCGTGLDTVPLPGDVSTGEIESILWDVAALAVRLGKPLTARLMPVPGKKAGDPTEFDFGYFKNSRVMRVNGQQVRLPLDSSDPIPLTPRVPNSHL